MGTARGYVRLYTSRDGAEWDSLVLSAWQYDFYHLSGYHALAERRGEGEALLIEYREGEEWVALPLLLCRSAGLPGMEGGTVLDATSVYGYPGPIASSPSLPAHVREAFQRELAAELGRRGVCTVFSRLHPLLAQERLLAGLGELVPVGKTVSIDLGQDPDEQYRAYRKGHRYDIKKLRRSGAVCVEDWEGKYLSRFVEVYQGTMRRIGAREEYMFDLPYFHRLLAMEGVTWRLTICLREQEIMCGGMFSLCGGIVQYHLSGSVLRYHNEAPTKLLLDDARRWANSQGAWALHLGGGFGSSEDSLFQFKAGFSRRRHTFIVWRWVTNTDRYGSLVARRRAWMASHGVEPAAQAFFPEHRAPLPRRDD